jgi:uncharacterized protein (DUF983 family)
MPQSEPERCDECGEMKVFRAYIWESKICDECADALDSAAADAERGNR